MSIQYAGGTIKFENAWAQTLGTKTELCNRIYANFLTAGWSSVSVSGSAPNVTGFTVQSAATTGGNLACRVVGDTSSTNCFHIYMQNSSGGEQGTTGQGPFLLPGIGTTWYMVINQYQFFIWQQGATIGRNSMCGGNLYLPTFLQGVITKGIWCNSSGYGDTSSGLAWRTRMQMNDSSTTPGYYYLNINGVVMDNGTNAPSSSSISGPHIMVLATPSSNVVTNQQPSDYRWVDGSVVVIDPLLSAPLTALGIETVILGQFYDSFVTMEPTPGDITVSYDSRTFICYTNYNTRFTPYGTPGTLWLATT